MLAQLHKGFFLQHNVCLIVLYIQQPALWANRNKALELFQPADCLICIQLPFALTDSTEYSGGLLLCWLTIQYDFTSIWDFLCYASVCLAISFAWPNTTMHNWCIQLHLSVLIGSKTLKRDKLLLLYWACIWPVHWIHISVFVHAHLHSGDFIQSQSCNHLSCSCLCHPICNLRLDVRRVLSVLWVKSWWVLMCLKWSTSEYSMVIKHPILWYPMESSWIWATYPSNLFDVNVYMKLTILVNLSYL